ncbi:hypothetical protein KAJ61_00460 [Candidatus Parcubacteria bacterium]|nr:hypothetical protein [Candidatus Parcubacteria bacterium]
MQNQTQNLNQNSEQNQEQPPKKDFFSFISVKTLLAILIFTALTVVIIGGWVYIIGNYGKNEIDNKIVEPAYYPKPKTDDWQNYPNKEYRFDVKYPKNLILNHYDEESLNKICYGCWRKVVILKNKKENYSIRFSVYTSDKYDLCKTQLYNERDLNKTGSGQYKVVSAEDMLFLFNKNIELDNIFKDGELNCVQSQCKRINDLVISVHLSASNLDDFILRNSDYVIQQANQILSTFKFID